MRPLYMLHKDPYIAACMAIVGHAGEGIKPCTTHDFSSLVMVHICSRSCMRMVYPSLICHRSSCHVLLLFAGIPFFACHAQELFKHAGPSIDRSLPSMNHGIAALSRLHWLRPDHCMYGIS